MKTPLLNISKMLVLLFGTALTLTYFTFRVQLISLSPAIVVFSILLFLAELHTILHFLGVMYSLWPRKYQKYTQLNTNNNLVINIFICVCGEPIEILRETILAAKTSAQKYVDSIHPMVEPRIIVLNDGLAAQKDNWYNVQELCRELGVYHAIREGSDGFKAGNINNAMRQLPATNPNETIDIVLDADFAALPELVTEITKPFTKANIDFVQTPQAYKNQTTWVAQAASAHQQFFYDYICQAKAHDNALFLCGTNFAIRRSALLDVDGMDTRFIAEDYATSLKLHLAGKKGVYMKKTLALGIPPATLSAYFSQQQRWAKGTFDASFSYMKQIIFGPLTLRQKLHYLLSATYYFIGVRDLIFMMSLIPYLFFGVSLLETSSSSFMLFVYAPMLGFSFIMYLLLSKRPIKTITLTLITFPVYIKALLSSLLKKKLQFQVTSKKYEKEQIFHLYKLQLFAVFLFIAGIIYSLDIYIADETTSIANYFWAIFNIVCISTSAYLIWRDSKIQPKIALARSYALPIKQYIATALALCVVFIVWQLDLVSYIAPRTSLRDVVANAQGQIYSEELLVPSQGIYYGYYMAEFNKHPQDPKLGIAEEETPTLAMYYQDWGTEAGFDSTFMNKISQHNTVPVITWEPWDVRKAETEGDLVQKDYAPQVVVSGKYDHHIRKFARRAASYNKPFFLRFAHEMNGNWYPWGVQAGNTPEDYKAMWRHVHAIFEEEGATNVIWVWSPNNSDHHGETSSMLSYYPGDEYVDWVAFSGFNWGHTNLMTRWVSFKDLAKPAYDVLITLNKPIMVAETSSVSYGGNKSNWFIKTLNQDIPSMPGIKALVIFSDDSHGADFTLEKGMDAPQVIKKHIMQNSYYLPAPLILTTEE